MTRTKSRVTPVAAVVRSGVAIAWAFLTVACTETAPPRMLNPRELDNLTAFANALGYVRFFHPTEAAAGVNWDAFAVRSIRAIGGATSDDGLAAALTSVFAPITSNVRFARTGTPLPATIPKPADATHAVFWRHLGVGTLSGGAASLTVNNLYQSERVVAPLSEIGRPVALPPDYSGLPISLPPVPDPSHPMLVALGGGVSMSMPIALFTHEEFVGGPRRTPSPSWVLERFSANDRATRLADVALAWSLFAHFYSYFDVVHPDWAAALGAALRSAATDADADASQTTLQRLVAALNDGHGLVRRASVPWQRHDVRFARLEGHVLVTAIGDSAAASGLKVGDEVLAVDGQPIEATLQELSTRESGASPQRIRWRALNEALLNGDPGTRAALRVSGADRAIRNVALSRVPNVAVKPSIDSIAEVFPGVMYLNLDRITTAAFDTLMPRLQRAMAVIFDMRGYPRLDVEKLFSHLADSVIYSPHFMVTVITLPNYQNVGFVDRSWTVAPAPPRVTARIIFLSGAGAVSAAETVLGVVEANRLGDIVGEPSAGTNGIINPFKLPGGYTVNWTDLLVQKRDGTPHHGVGVIPTVPVSPTVAGIRAGRDEVLERAISLATGPVVP